MIKKVEVLANIAVIFTSLVLCSVLVKKYFFTAKQTVAAATPSAQPPSISSKSKSAVQPGTEVLLPGIDWSKNSRTIVLALSTTCHFCSESGPFYQQIERQKPTDVGLIAVLPQPIEQSKAYLSKLGLKTSDVIQSSLSAIGVSGTPTILLVDNNGRLTASWAGKLPESTASTVVAQISQR